MHKLYLGLVLIILIGCSAPQPKGVQTTATAVLEAKGGQPAAVYAPNDQLLALALDQRAVGEYRPMQATLRQLLRQQPGPPLDREAQFRLAEAAFLVSDSDAAALLSAFVDQSPQHDDYYTRALFLLARAQENAGQHQAAITTYARYRDLHTPLEPYAARRAAAQQAAAGDRAGQIKTLEQVAAQVIAPQQRAVVLEELIRFYTEDGNNQAQLARYADLIALAQKPSYRADVLWRGVQVAEGAQRQGWLQTLVAELPYEQQALYALDTLDAEGIGVAPYPAAQLLLGHERWEAAVARFDQALSSDLSASDHFEARRLRALALRGQGNFDAALAELGELAQTQPATSGSIQAELDYVQTVGQSGNPAWAIDGYRRFAKAHSQDPLAAEAFWRVMQLQRYDDPASAMATALELGQSYGQSEQAHLALLDAAQYWYDRNDRPRAIEAWNLLNAGADGWDGAEGGFWAGATLLEQNERAVAQDILERAVIDAPQSYYGVRARELLKQPDAALLPLGSLPSVEERQAVEAWLAGWLGQPQPSVDAGWLPDLLANPFVQRARELGAVDLRSEARDEWFAARDQWNDDPVHLWQLALLASVESQPYPALKAAERIISLSPAKRITVDTPTGLLRLVYPAPYARVVRQYAQQFGVDPRLLYGLLRQESLFNPDATSWVGARGLAQVMPATAEGIAQNLKVADFQTEQLYQPALSVRFGAHYLGHQLRAFDGIVQAAAAAYNGGPGNAQRWLELSTDPDIFTELIDYKETREYVKLVYGNWGMYRTLYQE